MTTAQAVGAVSSVAAEWYAIDWQAVHRNVRRLQARIVKAVRPTTAFPRRRRSKGLSRMKGNFHVRF